MKIQFATTLKDIRGREFREPALPGGDPVKSISLGDVCCAVLDMPLPEEANERLKEKLRRAELAEKIVAAETACTLLDMLDADVEMLKERIGKRNYPAFLTAAACRLLDIDAGAAEAKVT